MAAGQDSLQPIEKEDQKKRWKAVYSEEAAKYQMFRRTDDIEELKLVPTPILTFANPVRERDQHGAAYVWTSDGRPEVLGAITGAISDTPARSQNLVRHAWQTLWESGSFPSFK